MAKKIRVTILDDHQSIIDGYLYRLNNFPQIEIVKTITFGEELEPVMAKNPTDVLLLDIYVPTSRDNSNPYPVLYTIPKLLDLYHDLSILVITMHNERSLIRSVMETGASGYILKEDQTMIRDLGNVILSVASGAIVFSQQVHELVYKNSDSTKHEQLLSRQIEILSLCAAYPDWTTAELARKMSLSNSTVRNLLSDAYLRLGVHTRLAAVTKARQLGIITPLSPNTSPK
jgi:two-component system, NarL family, nitrate/nitrite response regulator NarL